MVLIDAILHRRSIRKYTQENVSESDELSLLEAAMTAPSAGNERPWHFVMVRERARLDAIAAFQPHSHMLKEAPLAILVCGDTSQEMYPGFWPQDCAAATENILITAQDLGLGACWLGIYPVEERIKAMREYMGIPPHVIPFCLISIGHPGEKKNGASRFDPARVHTEAW
ncbi:MAG: nitroreductase family protein [Methanomassiliicoccales archaeon]